MPVFWFVFTSNIHQIYMYLPQNEFHLGMACGTFGLPHTSNTSYILQGRQNIQFSPHTQIPL